MSQHDLQSRAFLANLECVAEAVPELASAIVRELKSQRSNLKLIASENYSSAAVQAAMGNLLTDKYAEGVPGFRFYAGCENVDEIESLACKLACQLFNADHAYVQPHSGADANLIAFWAILRNRVEIPALRLKHGASFKSQKWNSYIQEMTLEDWNKIRLELGNARLLALDYSCGGHLTHGYRANVSARMFEVHTYTVNEAGFLDYDAIRAKAHKIRPLILLAGFSAYPRNINYREMRQIADEVGATLMVDMAHFAGLVAGGVLQGELNPVTYADIVTTTTHKTLRGPRGGLILCKKTFQEDVDKGCPLVIGGPLPHVMAAKAVCFTEALRPEFKDYAKRVVSNAAALASAFSRIGIRVHTNGTENHLVLLDLRTLGLTGFQAESALRQCRITLNRNSLPFDREPPLITSGLRLGSAAVSTLGMGVAEMNEIAEIASLVLTNMKPGQGGTGLENKKTFSLAEAVASTARERVEALLSKYPLYPSIDLEMIEKQYL